MPAALFVLGNLLFNTFAQICFKFSAASPGAGGFWLWQAVGNVSAFIGVLSYTAAMRWLPLHVAFPLTQGLAVVSVTLVGGAFIFHETIRPLQWLGVLLVAGGIALIGMRREA